MIVGKVYNLCEPLTFYTVILCGDAHIHYEPSFSVKRMDVEELEMVLFLTFLSPIECARYSRYQFSQFMQV